MIGGRMSRRRGCSVFLFQFFFVLFVLKHHLELPQPRAFARLDARRLREARRLQSRKAKSLACKQTRQRVHATRFLGDSLVENHALERALEPLHRVSLGKLVLLANLLLLLAAAGHAVTRALQHDVEIHTVDTRGRIVLDTEINVFGDTEAEVTRGTKVLLEKLKLLHLEAALQNLHRLVTVTDGDVGGNLFVTADTEGTHGVTGLGEDRLLAGELLQHLKIEKKNKRRRRQSFEVFCALLAIRALPNHPDRTSSKTRALSKHSPSQPW